MRGSEMPKCTLCDRNKAYDEYRTCSYCRRKSLAKIQREKKVAGEKIFNAHCLTWRDLGKITADQINQCKLLPFHFRASL